MTDKTAKMPSVIWASVSYAGFRQWGRKRIDPDEVEYMRTDKMPDVADLVAALKQWDIAAKEGDSRFQEDYADEIAATEQALARHARTQGGE